MEADIFQWEQRIAELERENARLKNELNHPVLASEWQKMEEDLAAEQARSLSFQNACVEWRIKYEEYVGAAQATIQQMRDFLTKIEYLEADNGCIMSAGECSNVASEALALPADRTALDAMLAEAEKRGMLKAAGICDEQAIRFHKGMNTQAAYGAGECGIAIRQAAERSE